MVSLTCSRSDRGVSEASRSKELSNSPLLALLTVALVTPPLPVRVAMTCSDSSRSCDSSGTSNKRKTMSKRESRAEPILDTHTHRHTDTDTHTHTMPSFSIQFQSEMRWRLNNSTYRIHSFLCSTDLPLLWISIKRQVSDKRIPSKGLIEVSVKLAYIKYL